MSNAEPRADGPCAGARIHAAVPPISIVDRSRRSARERGWLARIADVLPGALLTGASLLLVVAGAQGPRGWLAPRARPEPVAPERVVFAVPSALPPVASPAPIAPRAAGGRSSPGRATPAAPPMTDARPAAGATTDAPSSAAAPPAGRDTGRAIDTDISGDGTAPRAAVGPAVPRPVGAARPAPPPLDRTQLDSALATARAEMMDLARRGLVPRVRDDAARALAPLGPTGLSADGRRALARAVLEDERQRFEAMDRAARGLRPALSISRRLSFGGSRRPALPDSVVRGMIERNAARVRRREDSLRLAADSVRIRRELARRDSIARAAPTTDSATRGARPDAS